MTYTKKQFSLELREQLCRGYDVVRLSQWPDLVRLDNYRELEPGLRDIVRQIDGMDMGSEFELSEDELWKLADELEQG